MGLFYPQFTFDVGEGRGSNPVGLALHCNLMEFGTIDAGGDGALGVPPTGVDGGKVEMELVRLHSSYRPFYADGPSHLFVPADFRVWPSGNGGFGGA
jgi:hypothetical protein